MTFPRACILVIMITLTVREDDPTFWNGLITVTIGAVLWAFTRDPLPDAIRRGLDAYAKDYRK